MSVNSDIFMPKKLLEDLQKEKQIIFKYVKDTKKPNQNIGCFLLLKRPDGNVYFGYSKADPLDVPKFNKKVALGIAFKRAVDAVVRNKPLHLSLLNDEWGMIRRNVPFNFFEDLIKFYNTRGIKYFKVPPIQAPVYDHIAKQPFYIKPAKKLKKFKVSFDSANPVPADH